MFFRLQCLLFTVYMYLYIFLNPHKQSCSSLKHWLGIKIYYSEPPHLRTCLQHISHITEPEFRHSMTAGLVVLPRSGPSVLLHGLFLTKSGRSRSVNTSTPRQRKKNHTFLHARTHTCLQPLATIIDSVLSWTNSVSFFLYFMRFLSSTSTRVTLVTQLMFSNQQHCAWGSLQGTQ